MPYPFELRPLPFSYTALSPEISETTLHFHHDKHLQAYVDNLNKALTDCPELQRLSLEELLQTLDQIPEPSAPPSATTGAACITTTSISTAWAVRAGTPAVRWPRHGPCLRLL